MFYLRETWQKNVLRVNMSKVVQRKHYLTWLCLHQLLVWHYINFYYITYYITFIYFFIVKTLVCLYNKRLQINQCAPALLLLRLLSLICEAPDLASKWWTMCREPLYIKTLITYHAACHCYKMKVVSVDFNLHRKHFWISVNSPRLLHCLGHQK